MRIGEATANSTWEPVSSLPSVLVAEFEKGVQRQLVDHTFSSGGETVHTLSSRPITQSVKKPGMDVPSIMNTGYVICFMHGNLHMANVYQYLIH